MPKVETKYHILSIDDNKNNLFTLKALLSSLENAQTTEVLSAKEALDILLKEKIDLILCDVQMPEINGFEFAKIIKSNKKTKDIPIIFVTAIFKSEDFIKEGFELGAIDYITKPIDDHQLLNKINLYLKIFQEKNRAVENEKLFYDIAQSIGDGIYTLDKELKATFINDVALKLLGFEKKELLGQNIHEYIHYKNVHNEHIPIEECLADRSMREGDIFKNDDDVLIKKNGDFLYVSLTATPLFAKNELIGTVVVFKDKTDTKKINFMKKERRKNKEQIIHSMIEMIEARDSYTAGHTKRVAHYCVLIAKEMGYKQDEIDILEHAAWLHDIGKISTPDNVLLKPGKLNTLEYNIIQEHLTTGYNMLSKIDQYKPLADIMREHHERFDGTGYPRGLKGDEIQPLSRIMMVADSFDAMTTNRIYKAKKSIKVALEELKTLSGVYYHPEVVASALIALKDVKIDTEISQLPQTTIEEQRFSYFYRDRLTGLFVVEYLNLILKYYLHSVSVYMYKIELHNFGKYNKEFGWKKGDTFLINFSEYLNSVAKNALVFRVEGDDFLLLSEKKIENFQKEIDDLALIKDINIQCKVKEEFVKDVHEKFKF